MLDFQVKDTTTIPDLPETLQGYPCYFSFNAPIIDSPTFLTGLLQELQHDKTVEVLLDQPLFASLEEVAAFAVEHHCSAIVKATGLGSRQLLKDERMHPARGPLLMYKRPAEAKVCITIEEPPLGSETAPAYIIPRAGLLCVGGSFQIGDNNTEITEEELQRLKRNAEVLCPQVAGKEPVQHWVGFRPYRENGIRFDKIEVSATQKSGTKVTLPVFNNYGHGGSGWTLHYGAAKATVEEVEKHLA